MKTQEIGGRTPLNATCLSWLRRGLLALCVATAGAPAAAGVPPWPEAPYSYFADGTPIESVLAEFAGSFSLGLTVQPGVRGAVSGRFTARTPTEFISRLGGVYGFSWYTHAGTLHISRTSDTVMRSIPLPSGSAANLRLALYELGVLETRFGWGELPEQGVVMVSGPASYVSLIENTFKQLPGPGSAQQVTVFRLRHASAEDRIVTYRDKQLIQPGLASVLRQVIAGQAGGVSTPNEVSIAPPQPARAALPLSGGAEGAGTAGAPAPAAGAAGGGGILGAGGLLQGLTGGGRRQQGNAPASEMSRLRPATIQSDPRLNALIIQDVPERLPLYERLIAQLDVPTPLIEIEAMIIDVNTERAKELGINWSARAGSVGVTFGALGAPSTGTLGLGLGTAGSTTIVPDAGTYLLSQIRLLESNGDARIQSRPSVLTTDNIGALLDLSETFYIRVLGERVANVTPITAGTTLKVTPRLVDGPEPSIQLAIDIEDGQIQDRQIDMLPTVRRSTVSTQAVVRNNDTLLIAGYSSDQNIEANQKVPVLGDLPGLGLLFSNKQRSVQKRERLFMIRPKLVTLPTSLAGAAPQVAQQAAGQGPVPVAPDAAK